MNFEKAFDHMPRMVLWWALRSFSVEECTIRVIHGIHSNAQSHTRANRWIASVCFILILVTYLDTCWHSSGGQCKHEQIKLTRTNENYAFDVNNSTACTCEIRLVFLNLSYVLSTLYVLRDVINRFCYDVKIWRYLNKANHSLIFLCLCWLPELYQVGH